MSNALALVDGSKAGSLVVSPQSFPEVVQFAEMMAKCTFVPKHLRGQPANCMAVTLQALRWSMDPFSVAQKTYFVQEGSAPGYEAQLINAVILSRAPLEGRPRIEWSGDNGALTCTVTGKFRGDPDPKTKTCRLANITTKNSPLWKADPEQQLAYYTTRAWARLYCPDIILGVYTPDEMAESAIGPDAAIDVTPPRAASRLDALEQTISGEAPSPARPPAVDPYTAAEGFTKGNDDPPLGGTGSGEGAPSAWDRSTETGDYQVGNPFTRETRRFATVEQWCGAICALAHGRTDAEREKLWRVNAKTADFITGEAGERSQEAQMVSAAHTFVTVSDPVMGSAG